MRRRSCSLFIMTLLLAVLMSLPVAAAEDTGRAYYDFGVFAFEDGAYADAEANFQKALEAKPENPFYHHYLGKTYLQQKRYKKAETHLMRAFKIDPEIAGLQYDLAFLKFQTGDYAAAAPLFIKVSREDAQNVLAAYYAGVCLFKQTDYREALDYFIRASEMSPSVKPNGYYYAGICYAKNGQFESALTKLAFVRDNAESEALRTNAAKWIDSVSQRAKARRPYTLYFRIGGQYDDNVKLEAMGEDTYSDESDTALEGFFMGKYDFLARDRLTIGAGGTWYETIHNDLKEYDLIGGIGNLYVKYRINAFVLGASLLPSYYWVDYGEYLRRYQFKPQVTWNISQALIAKAAVSFADNTYFMDEDRDGATYEASSDLYYLFADNKGYLLGGFAYETNRADHDDYDYVQYKSKVGASINVPWQLTLGLTLKYYNKDYDHTDSEYGTRREDNKYNCLLSASRPIGWDWLSIIAELDYTYNDSNIDDYEYERKVLTLSVAAKF